MFIRIEKDVRMCAVEETSVLKKKLKKRKIPEKNIDHIAHLIKQFQTTNTFAECYEYILKFFRREKNPLSLF